MQDLYQPFKEKWVKTWRAILSRHTKVIVTLQDGEEIMGRILAVNVPFGDLLVQAGEPILIPFRSIKKARFLE